MEEQFKTIAEDTFNDFMWSHYAIYEVAEITEDTVNDVVWQLFLKEFGKGGGEEYGLSSVDSTFALNHASRFLCKSMAYGQKLWSTEEAESFWEGVVATVENSVGHPDLHYYSNTTADISSGCFGFNPVTKHTFDTGLAVASVKSRRIGIICVADED